MISVVIAAFNEERRIACSLLKIADHFEQMRQEHEVIVVDDGSTDGTSRVVRAFDHIFPRLRLVRYEANRGKGYALRRGVLASEGDPVLVTDADLSTPIEELGKLMFPVSKGLCEIAIGSRALALSEILKSQPLWRQGMGKIFNWFVKAMVMEDFADTQCGFKLFSGKAARTVFPDAVIDRFASDVEILVLARNMGYRIMEIPIRWINSPDSRVNPVSDSMRMLRDLVRIRLRSGSLKKLPAGCTAEEPPPINMPASGKGIDTEGQTVPE